MISQHLPFVMGEIFNRPHAISEASAQMVVAALSGRLRIESLVNGFDTMDARGLEDLAELGRLEARERKAKTSGHTGVARQADNGLPYELSPTGIAILPVKGMLRREWGIGPYSGATGYDGLWAQYLHAIANDDVKAIWMPHNSGGGAIDGLQDLADFIYANSARSGGKPVWAYIGDQSCSASYWLASAADRVIMPPLGLTASIGCVVIHTEITGMLEQEGITATIFRSKDRKARGGDMEPLDEEAAAKYQALVDTADAVFSESVARNRGISKKAVSETRGDVYMASQALATGLVNEVLTEPEAWMKLERKVARM